MNGSATNLSARYDHVAAVPLEDPRGRGVGLREKSIGDATEEERDPGAPWADRR